MLKFENVKVYDLKESVIASGYAMRTELPEITDEEFEKGLERMKRLVLASQNGTVKSHDNATTGIRVSFDMVYTQYITKQFQRYHWFDYVSSSSMMHRITKMDFTKCVNKYVDPREIQIVKEKLANHQWIVDRKESWGSYSISDLPFPINKQTVLTFKDYNTAEYTAFMEIISNCPMGAELFVHVSTNYKQLQTIYFQREHHKLKEDYTAFKKMVESLPYANELILGKYAHSSNK